MAEFGVPSAVVRSCFAWQWSSEHPVRSEATESRRTFYGLDGSAKKSDPEWVIRLARELPGHRFDIVGPCGVDAAYGRPVIAEIESLSNAR